MCVIAIYQEKRPSLEQLQDMENTNTDGAGIAWREKEYVKYKKGLTAEEIYTISQEVSYPFIIHFRLATHGGKSPLLCHPFPVSPSVPLETEGQAKKVLFHNGIWTDWKRLCIETVIFHRKKFIIGKISDSRALAWFVYHHGEGVLTLLDEKVVIFSTKKLQLYGNWIEKEGAVYSNLSWQRGVYPYAYDSPYGNCYNKKTLAHYKAERFKETTGR